MKSLYQDTPKSKWEKYGLSEGRQDHGAAGFKPVETLADLKPNHPLPQVMIITIFAGAMRHAYKS